MCDEFLKYFQNCERIWEKGLLWVFFISSLLYPGASLLRGGSKCKFLLCPAERQCQPGEVRVIPEGECCPVCQPCSTVPVACPNPPPCGFIGESLQVPKGGCCPQCLPDPCARILCAAPVCLPESGEVPFVHEGNAVLVVFPSRKLVLHLTVSLSKSVSWFLDS